MKIAVMQPYLFPYVGYWQLVNCVDTFVFFDDVNFIKKGYINRNNIMVNGKKHVFTMPVRKASQNKLINELSISHDHKLLKTIELAYRKAPYFEEVFDLVTSIFNNETENLSQFVEDSISKTSAFMGLNTLFIKSSQTDKPDGLKGQEKILAICRTLHADSYVNAIGGQDLYQKDRFAKEGIELGFIRCQSEVPYTSIIDLLMTLGKEQVCEALNQYEVI